MPLRDVEQSVRESDEDIANRFITAAAREIPGDINLRAELFSDLAKRVTELAQVLNSKVPDSPNKSHSLRQFEDALMWAGKAIFE